MGTDSCGSMIAYCGLYCVACSFKTACEEKDMRHILAMPGKYDKHKTAPLEAPCAGCKPDPDSCGDCGIRTCAEAKGVGHCGACADFPCERITAFANDGIPHHMETLANLRALRDLGEEKWLQQQKERWTCSCGARLSWYLAQCPKCSLAIKRP